MIPNHSRPLAYQVNKHHHKKKPGAGGADKRDGKGHRHKHRNNNHHKRPPTNKLTENDLDATDSSLNIPLTKMAPSSPSSSASENIALEEDDQGIVIHFDKKSKKASGPLSKVPSLPSGDYYEDSPKLSRYTDSGQRDQLAEKEARKWRTYTILSDDGTEVIGNKDAIEVDGTDKVDAVAKKDAVVVDVPDIRVTSDDDDDDDTEQGTVGVGNGETIF